MASTKSTIYDVSVLYKMDDRASGALADLAKNAGSAESRVLGLKETLLGIGAALGGRALFGAGKEAFIDFNSNVEQAKLGIAAVTKMFNEDMGFDQALGQADKLFEHYQQVAKQSAGTTMDFVNMHKMIAPSLEAAGASMNDFKAIVKGAVTTAPIAGYNSEMAALEMKQMLAGTIGGKDRFATMLIAQGKMSVKAFNEKAKSDPQFALDFLGKVFNSGALKEARKRMEHTFDGAVSTLKDNIEIGLGKAGKPIFEAIRGTLNDINDWIDKHPKEIEEWTNRITHGLIEGFGMVKSAIGFIVDHKSEILAIAGAFAAVKGMTILGTSAAGGISGFASAIMGLKDASLMSTKGFATFSSNLTTAAGALVGLYMAAQAFADWVDGVHKTNVEKEAEQGAMGALYVARKTAREMQGATGGDFAKGLNAQGDRDAKGALAGIVTHIKDWGTFTKDAQVDWAKFSAKVQDLNMDPNLARELGPMVDEAFKKFGADQSIWDRLGLPKPNSFDDKDPNARKKAQKTAVNVTIHKVEVASPDPDRFAFGLDKAFKKLAQNPTSARDSLRGGF